MPMRSPRKPGQCSRGFPRERSSRTSNLSVTLTAAPTFRGGGTAQCLFVVKTLTGSVLPIDTFCCGPP